MGPKIQEKIKATVAVANTSGTVAALVGTAVNATGYSRARFIFSFGNGAATTAEFESGIGIWESATSGGTYTSRSTAVIGTNITSGVVSSAAVTVEIELPISTAKPWLKVSGGSNLSTGLPHSCIVELYDVNSMPITTGANTVVTI